MAHAFNNDRSKADLSDILRGSLRSSSFNSPDVSLFPITLHDGSFLTLSADISFDAVLKCISFAESTVSGLEYTGMWTELIATPNSHEIRCIFQYHGSQDKVINSPHEFDNASVSYYTFNL